MDSTAKAPKNGATIRLYLDDVRNPPEDGGGPWTVCRTAAAARDVLQAGGVEEATLDHDLGPCSLCDTLEEDGEGNTRVIDSAACPHLRNGYDLVKWMAEHDVWPRLKPRVHSANPAGTASMVATIERYWPTRVAGTQDRAVAALHLLAGDDPGRLDTLLESLRGAKAEPEAAQPLQAMIAAVDRAKHRAEPAAVDDVLQVHGQSTQHHPVYLVGTALALVKLRDTINETLASGRPEACQTFAADGEGYTIAVIPAMLTSDDMLPYPNDGPYEGYEQHGRSPHALLSADDVKRLFGPQRAEQP